VGIFLFGFLYFALYIPISQIQTSIANVMSGYSGDSTYASYQLADIFMQNLWTYLLVIMVLGLLYWAWIYSQRKSVEYGGYA